MSENASPNPMRRKLIQTKLVFGKKNQLTIDSNKPTPLPKTKKRMKKQKRDTTDKTTRVESTVVDLTESQPQVDPRLLKNDSDDCLLLTDDEVDEHKELPHTCVVGTDEIPEVITIDEEYEKELKTDCEDNNPIVVAKKTMDQMKEECLSLGLTLDTETFVDSSDSEDEVCTSSAIDYEVEAIYDSKMENRLTYFWVKWKNYTEEDNTWEPWSNLRNCRKLVDEYKSIKQSNNENMMKVYHNWYRLKGIIDDIVDKKVAANVTTTVLLILNNVPLNRFHYTKKIVKNWRLKLKESLTQMDSISDTKSIDKRIEKIEKKYYKLIDELNILKRFQTIEEFFAFFDNRKKLERRLTQWEDHVNSIIISEKEGQTIKIENYVDCEGPPNDFKYIARCQTEDKKIIIAEDPPVYCQCIDCEDQQNDCCVTDNKASIVYTKNGILKDSRNVRNAIYECNKKCKCSENCINRVFQKGRKHKLAIFRTDDGKGWGVRTLEAIPKGSYVMEYVGEIITVAEANKRGAIYDAEGRTYLFDLDFTPDDGSESEQYKYTLDATQFGNVSHFVNHSCDPNLDTKVVWVNNQDPFMPHIALFAVKTIRLNEELTFDYKINVHGISDTNQSQAEKSFDSGIGSESTPTGRVECRCGAFNCRKYVF